MKLLMAVCLCLLSPLLFAKAPIVIGIDADMSAVAAEGGVAIYRGAQLAVNRINEQGGVLGRKLRLDVRDHRGNPARGLANIQFFADQPNVIAILGGVHTPVALKELPLIHEKKIIYLGPWAAGTSIVDNDYTPNYVFRLSVRDQHAGHVLVRHATQRKFKKVGLLLERTGWGRSNEASMTAASVQQDLEIVGVEWFNWREQDVAGQVVSLLNQGAEAIMLVANAPEGAVIIKYMASLPPKQRVPILSHWGIAGGAFTQLVGFDVLQAVDLSILQTYSFLRPAYPLKNDDLLRAYRDTFDSSVTARSVPAAVGVVHAYDLVHLLAMAITQAQTTDRTEVRDALENIDSYQGVFKHFKTPFTVLNHDALTHDDYIISRYDNQGYLVPIE
ncbi:MAG: ABC transporter substrate-binding protein [Cellvibrionaceae bacterium]|nr:ABC transporter substrate-binding protein [Cellvibrionaceae bacterium]